MTEYEIQKAIVKWVKASNDPRLAFMYATPNEGRRSPAHYQKRKSEGMLSGVPDLHLPYPIHDREHPLLIIKPGLFVEVKTPNGELSKVQQDFKNFCDGVGYPYVIVRTVDAGIQAIKSYLWLEDRQSEVHAHPF